MNTSNEKTGNAPPDSARPEGNATAPYAVPAQGSLGLLAVGYRGVEAWRAARKNHRTATKNDPR